MKPKSLAERVTALEEWLLPMRMVIEAQSNEIGEHARILEKLIEVAKFLEPLLRELEDKVKKEGADNA